MNYSPCACALRTMCGDFLRNIWWKHSSKVDLRKISTGGWKKKSRRKPSKTACAKQEWSTREKKVCVNIFTATLRYTTKLTTLTKCFNSFVLPTKKNYHKQNFIRWFAKLITERIYVHIAKSANLQLRQILQNWL